MEIRSSPAGKASAHRNASDTKERNRRREEHKTRIAEFVSSGKSKLR
jgi:hypothetical protein